MAYKAVFTYVSDIDVNGYMDVTFDLRRGTTVLYPGLTVNAPADQIEQVVTDKANALSDQIREGKKIKVGDSIDIQE